MPQNIDDFKFKEAILFAYFHNDKSPDNKIKLFDRD